MIFEHYSKNRKILLFVSAIILIAGIFFFLYSSVIFQEGNPWPQIKGIIQLTFGKSDIVKLSDSDNRYLTKSQDGHTMIEAFMKDKGYEYTEQMGSGYFYKSSDKTIILARRQYSRFYVIWTIIENSNNNLWITITNNEGITFQYPKELSIAEELKDCLPKSDTVSHEKCNKLLATIRNFDDCVNAGFAIMKSNPPQCTTLDNRIFIDEANSIWNAILIALNNCEVESVFQTHSKLVTLELKNGNKIIAYEPQIDDVMKVVSGLNGRCGDIRMATE